MSGSNFIDYVKINCKSGNGGPGSSHLFRDKLTAEFPDAITSRGSKHLLTLIDAIKKGYKAYLIFLVQIQNMEKFKIARDIDSEYYKNYLKAQKAGVNFLAYRCKITAKEILIEKKIKIIDE